MKKTLKKLVICLLRKLLPYRTVAAINDCFGDSNAQGRVATEISHRFGHPAAALITVRHTLEASLNILDQLNVGAEVILVNIAPRDGADGKIYSNGTRFGYFWIGRTFVLSTLSGFTLSLVKKFKLIKEIRVLDLEKSVDLMVKKGLITHRKGEEIKRTQFRSCYFQPLAAKAILDGISLPYTVMPIADIPDAPPVIAVVDCFGNGKTTVLAGELNIEKGQVMTAFGTLPFYQRLADVPDGTTAVIQGSSGLPGRRFAEIVINGGRASDQLGFKVGDKIY